MAFSENGHHIELSEEMLYQELADTYQFFTNLFENGSQLLADYLESVSRLLRVGKEPTTEYPVIALQAARNYTSRLRAPIPPCYFPQVPVAHLVESVLHKLNYKDLMRRQVGDDYLAYEKYTVSLVEREKHFLTEGASTLGVEQTCAVIDSLRMSLACPTLHSDA